MSVQSTRIKKMASAYVEICSIWTDVSEPFFAVYNLHSNWQWINAFRNPTNCQLNRFNSKTLRPLNGYHLYFISGSIVLLDCISLNRFERQNLNQIIHSLQNFKVPSILYSNRMWSNRVIARMWKPTSSQSDNWLSVKVSLDEKCF